MSIFHSTFKDYVKDQINTRESLLSIQGDRPIEFQKYVSGKSPWVRMTSFVDYKGSSDLARSYVLQGGTLYQTTAVDQNNKTVFVKTLRGGLSKTGAVYDSELGSNQYGKRPMPGIESITSRNIGAYGSLRETSVKYYAWDLEQLQNLNILYMKPGYPVLVEWGWSSYLVNNTNFNLSSDFNYINIFKNTLDIEDIYKEIKLKVEKYDGNYDATLGFIKNYNYTLLKNGGFECTTTLISMGDIINSLKINAGVSEASTSVGGEDASNDPFCKLLTEISNASVTSFPGFEDMRRAFPTEPDRSAFPNGLPPGSISDWCKVIKAGDDTDTTNLPGGDSRYTKFITFNYFVHILNNYTSLFSSKDGKDHKNNITKIEYPDPSLSRENGGDNYGNGWAVSSPNAMSINNDVCFIENSNIKILKDTSGKVIPFHVTSIWMESPNSNPLYSYYFPYPNYNLGKIGAIYLNIGFLISTYKNAQRDSAGSVLLGPYLKKILQEVEFTLGSINKFDLISIDNRGIIIDKHYVEPKNSSGKSRKFQLNIMGLKTTVRDHQVVSKIFEEQSTMIAIAAQDRENVAAIQTSTNVAMNRNLTNRLYKSSSNRKSPDANKTDKDDVYKNLQSLMSFVSNYIITAKRPIYKDVTLTALNTYLNQFITVGDRGTDYRGIVPISLNVKLDGIAGITIGEIFRINANILPSEYEDKSVGFIVTGVDHEINRADWTTNLKTQFCLLDYSEYSAKAIRDSAEFLQDFTKYIEYQKEIVSHLIHKYNMLIAFLVDFYNDRFQINNYSPTFSSNTTITYKDDIPAKDRKLQAYADSIVSTSTDPVALRADQVAVNTRQEIFGDLVNTVLLGADKTYYRNRLVFDNSSTSPLKNPISLKKFIDPVYRILDLGDGDTITNPTDEDKKKLGGSFEYKERSTDERRKNVVNFLNTFLLTYSTTYSELNNSAYGSILINLYSSVKTQTSNIYLNVPTTKESIISALGNLLSFAGPSAGANDSLSVIAIADDIFRITPEKSGQVSTKYISLSSIDAYGKIIDANILYADPLFISTRNMDY